MLNIYLQAQKQATEREHAAALKRAYKKLRLKDQQTIRFALYRLAAIPELRAMTPTDAFELLAKIGLAIS